MARRARLDFAKAVTLPVISSCRNRLHAFVPSEDGEDGQKDVIIDLKASAGKRHGPSQFEQVLIKSKKYI